MKASELFHRCAYDITYQQAGDSVNYAFENKGTTLYIYFQGSNSISDWVRNFLFPAKPYKDMEIPYRVHRGFLAAWKEVEDIIIAKITEKKADDTFKWKKIVVIGYSHGGALAAFCHECCWFWRPDLREHKLIGYGFEAPRIYAGYRVKKALQERWQNFIIIRTGSDIVTHCPPCIFGFTHVSDVVKIVGDPSLVTEKLPKFVKYHFPQVVYQALVDWENGEPQD